MKIKVLSNFAESKNKVQMAIGLSVAYLFASILATWHIIDRGFSQNTFHQYFDVTVIAVLFGVVWILLGQIIDKSYFYAKSISKSREAPAFFALTHGAQFLYISLVITAFLNVLRIPPAGEIYQNVTIAIYYLAGLLAATYMYFIGKTGRVLAKYINRSNIHTVGSIIILLMLGVISVLILPELRLAALTRQNPDHILSYLSINQVLLTLYIPLVIGWAYGLSGALGIFIYQRKVKGIVYKKLMIGLTAGTLLLVIVSTSRHISDFVLGSASQTNIPVNFVRVLILFGLVILAMLSMNNGLKQLSKLEKLTN